MNNHEMQEQAFLSYHDYVVVVLGLDAEWTRNGYRKKQADNSAPHKRVFDQLRSSCSRYAENIIANYSRWLTTKSGTQATSTENLRSFLFDPRCYVQFGRSDCLGIVLLDDFDPVHYLSAQCPTTVEAVSLAFAPKMERLMNNTSPWICDFHEFDWPSSSREPTKKEAPILLFSKIKLDGLAALGASLQIQTAALRAIAHRINDALTDLRHQAHSASLTHFEIDEEDIIATRVSFLDLQGAEEIGLMIRTPNSSIGAVLLSAIQTLTFADTFLFDESLPAVLEASEAHLEVLRRYSHDKGVPIPDLAQNHVFRWTNSLLALSESAYLSQEENCTSGLVQCDFEIQVACGHQDRLSTRLESELRFSANPVSGLLNEHPHWVLGTSDIISRLPFENSHDCKQHVTFSQMVSAHRKTVNSCVGDSQGRDIVGLSVRISIPYPKTQSVAPFPKNHCAPLGYVLGSLRDALFDQPRVTGTSTDTPISIPRLKALPRSYRLPVTLRRTIEFLYQDFAVVMGNPMLFDTLLDAYDALSAFYKLLLEVLPSILTKTEHGSEIDEKVVEEIAYLSAAARAVLEDHLDSPYPDVRSRDMDVDVRGGLQQVLLAGDAVQKCVTGLFRRLTLNSQERLGAVGVFTQISLMPGIRTKMLSAGIDPVVRVGVIDIDVAHVLSPISFSEYFHEAFHLVFDECFANGQNPSKIALSHSSEERVLTNRLSEFFVHLVHRALFEGTGGVDYNEFQLARFSDSVRCAGSNFKDKLLDLGEVLVRLFLVDQFDFSDPLRPKATSWINDPALPPDPRIQAEYWEFCLAYGVFVREVASGQIDVRADSVKNFLFQQLMAVLRDVRPVLPNVIEGAVRFLADYKNRYIDPDHTGRGAHLERHRQLELALKSGQPLAPTQDGRNVDLTFFVSGIISAYVNLFRLDRDKVMHLMRDERGDITFDSDKFYNEFLLDRGAASRFCYLPSRRASRLRAQITMFKMYWNVSSILRGRRLRMMLEAHLGPVA